MKVGPVLVQRRDDSTDNGTALGQLMLLSGYWPLSGSWENFALYTVPTQTIVSLKLLKIRGYGLALCSVAWLMNFYW